MQELQMECPTCKGTGHVIGERDRCKRCHGDKVVEERKVLEVIIKAGMWNGHRIAFKGEGDQAPGVIPGDVLIVLQEKDHPVFKREKSNLILEHELSLVEALTGFQFVINHLDGRILYIRSTPGQIIKPGDSKVIWNEGMPKFKDTHRGNMVVKFRVRFPLPHEINPQVAEQLKMLLPRPYHMHDFTGLGRVYPVQLFDLPTNVPPQAKPDPVQSQYPPYATSPPIFDPFGFGASENNKPNPPNISQISSTSFLEPNPHRPSPFSTMSADTPSTSTSNSNHMSDPSAYSRPVGFNFEQAFQANFESHENGQTNEEDDGNNCRQQ
jgi:hypothetical protein